MFPNKCLPALIDHTLLRPEATEAQIKNLCQEAINYNFGAVCILPFWVSYAAKLLQNTSVKVCTVVGFPLGGNKAEIKALETKLAIADGAQEIDMVINLGALKSGQIALVKEDIQVVIDEAKKRSGILVKVILETCSLNQEEKILICHLAQEAGADLVKTSTGFGTCGATVEDVQLLRKTIGPNMGIKASGGIRTLDKAMALLEAGATRLGTSSGVSLVTEWRKNM